MGSYGLFTQNDATPTSRNIKTYQETTSTAQVQITRTHNGTATTRSSWTLATTGATPISADVQRVGWKLVNMGNARVYFGVGTAGTATLTSFGSYLDPGDRYVCGSWEAELAVTMIAEAVGGSVYYELVTAA